MTASHHKPEAIARGARMLRTALGPAISRFLEDPAVVEVMLNPDGRLWIDRLSEGLSDTGETLSPADGERIVRPLGLDKYDVDALVAFLETLSPPLPSAK